MPAKLVSGENAHDVAAYVAPVAASGGKDTGLLATRGARPPAAASRPSRRTASLTIPADPNGQLAYVGHQGDRARRARVTIEMPNKSGIQHDIVIDGLGKGEIVTERRRRRSRRRSTRARPTRTTARSRATAQAGMQGTLTVK